MFVLDVEERMKQEKRRNPELKVFQGMTNTIADLLVGCLKTVSDECLDRGLIARETYNRIVYGDAEHASTYIRKILSTITDKIKENPKNLEIFIRAVLEPMGHYAAELITNLRK